MGAHSSPRQSSSTQRDLLTKTGKRGKTGGNKKGAPPNPGKGEGAKAEARGRRGGRGRTELGRVKALLACAVLSVKTKKDIGEGRSHNKVEAPVPTDPKGPGAEPRNLPQRVRLTRSTKKTLKTTPVPSSAVIA